MKISKLCLGGFLFFVLLAFFAAGMANAQFPDLSQWEGKWFKLTLKTTENVYSGDKIEIENISNVLYLGITKFNSPTELIGVVWEQTDTPAWEPFDIKIKVIGGTDLDFLCTYMETEDILSPTNPSFFGFAARITGKLSKGVLKSATLKTLGGFTWEQHPSPDLEYIASGLSMSGSLIDPSKLPFTP